MCATACFAGTEATNLYPVAAFAGPTADGGVSCSLDGAKAPDSSYAGLGYAGTTSTTIDGIDVTSCVVVDLGRACRMSDELAIGYSIRRAQDICGDHGGLQCKLPEACGTLPGVSGLLFAGLELDQMRYLFEGGTCKPDATPFGGTGAIHPATGPDLAAVRYLMACRPATQCDADAANLEVEALFLAYRP
jgi:hypothetical protein